MATATARTAPRLLFDAPAPARPGGILAAARAAESRGMDRLVVSETAHNPFVQLARAADATRSIELATGVAIAFARTPMTLAYEAWGVHEASGGRAVVGLGSQVKPHVVRRFGMPWDRPAARMAEYLHAVRAIWDSWQTGERLVFRGDFYTHTLMTPAFTPGRIEAGAPRLLLAGVGPRMAATAGAVADGFIAHPFSSVEHLTRQLLPGVLAARAKAEAERAPWTDRPFEVVGNVLAATGRTEEELAAARIVVRERIAFYASTPAYRSVLELHGWGELHEQLHRMSLRGRWQEMGELIDDEVFRTFAVSGTPEEAAREIHRRYAGVVTRLSVSPATDDADPADALEVLAAVRALDRKE
ncbi:TIGR03617 family F420-dependent LLM class oxidoreductase [Streptacidiphilus sp. PB12-B1b]|uniref:TIGR03617 family F420-dependent LLM class oxidoreductase n=1 Tax=Streptacidiphilus sp. PB12-B1b TaxID=2705012 RepID=UPI0015FB7CC7|nr:TIGR03617 family F420-dependent LLM class oxidoreductase [Streptacidiphilus sp. PB12-B1b]QMU77892.1 TIGR03617 family F420-dependent LLM class oxidoreductase [Streptacidiphilus sp. PB12-B1b]